jgi:Uma2 family endonuclease
MNKPVQLAESTQARFTTAEFLRMVDSGAFDDMTIELMDGALERMNPPMSGHGAQQAQITALLWHACAGTALQVLGEVGIDLGDDTVLACDAAIARAAIDSNRLLTAADLLLVVEVGETTRSRDLNRKRTRYAAAGIPDYWVVDGARAVVHVHREPVDGEYALVRTVRFGEPLAVPGTEATITLA